MSEQVGNLIRCIDRSADELKDTAKHLSRCLRNEDYGYIMVPSEFECVQPVFNNCVAYNCSTEKVKIKPVQRWHHGRPD